MTEPELRFAGTLESFFYERTRGAQERRSSPLPAEVEAYVVYMLADQVRRTNLAGRTSGPLALQFLAAREQQGARRAPALRAVGDRALFIAGVVPHSIDRGPVDLHYVRSIGAAAYRQIAEPAVFHSLAASFNAAAEVISDATDDCGEGDILGLYERWQKYGDIRDERRLGAAGVVLVRGRRGDLMQ